MSRHCPAHMLITRMRPVSGVERFAYPLLHDLESDRASEESGRA